LDTQLKEKNSRLFVARGQPVDTLKELIVKWDIKLIAFEHDTEPYSMSRDQSVRELCLKLGVKVHTDVSHTLYDPNKIKEAGKGKVPTKYQGHLTLMEKLGPPPKPLEVPDFSKIDAHDEKFGAELDLPTLAEIDLSEEKDCGPRKFPGGESEALKRLEATMKNKEWVAKFEKPNTSPNSLQPSTTVLSPYLKFGCLSPRKFYYELLVIINADKKATRPPVSLLGQLFWREFYYSVSAATPNYDKMAGNPICKQIDWRPNDEFLNAWKNAQTGFPFIDAIMTQLRTEGWIHHLARHSVACFLTRGDLYISWEEGVKVFEEYLLDADWALNAGNWMWLSASAFFYQYFRVYSPVAFGKKTDPNGDYIRQYIPQLKKFPKQFIYEPWMAPIETQKHCKCIIGKDYPKPIVDHAKASAENLKRMKAAYDKDKRTV